MADTKGKTYCPFTIPKVDKVRLADRSWDDLGELNYSEWVSRAAEKALELGDELPWYRMPLHTQKSRKAIVYAKLPDELRARIEEHLKTAPYERIGSFLRFATLHELGEPDEPDDLQRAIYGSVS